MYVSLVYNIFQYHGGTIYLISTLKIYILLQSLHTVLLYRIITGIQYYSLFWLELSMNYNKIPFGDVPIAAYVDKAHTLETRRRLV